MHFQFLVFPFILKKAAVEELLFLKNMLWIKLFYLKKNVLPLSQV